MVIDRTALAAGVPGRNNPANPWPWRSGYRASETGGAGRASSCPASSRLPTVVIDQAGDRAAPAAGGAAAEELVAVTSKRATPRPW